jgi:hypothetical protein
MAVVGPPTPVSDDELRQTWAQARDLAPESARVVARALDRHYMVLTVPEATPAITMEPDLPPERIGSIALDIQLADGLEVEAEAAALIDRLEQALAPEAIAAFHTSLHLDLVTGDAAEPPAFTFTINNRRPEHSREDYVWLYRTQHVPLAKAIGPLFVRYITHHTLYERGSVFGDTITIQEYASIDDIDRHIRTRTAPSDDAINDIVNIVGHVDYYIGDRVIS